MRVLLVVVILLGSLGLGGWWWFTRDTTIYAPAYSEQGFAQVEPGMELDQVLSLLGEPLVVRRDAQPVTWCFDRPGDCVQAASLGTGVTVTDFFLERRCVKFDADHTVTAVSGHDMEDVVVGMTEDEVNAVLGEPVETSPASVMALHYSRPGGDNLFRARIVKIDGASRVSEIVTYQFYD